MPNTPTGMVAIVDDDAGVRIALSRLLDASGIRTQSYASAREFLESLATSTPDCLIVDLQMPEMSGLELQQQLSRSGVRIPVIVITAHDNAESRRRCLAEGAAAYLTKPFNIAALLAIINSAVA
jgi:FixJ family two-component response regulator